jgi:hypothetical protein
VATYIVRLPNGQPIGIRGVHLNPPNAQTVEVPVVGGGTQTAVVVTKYSDDDEVVPQSVLRMYES